MASSVTAPLERQFGQVPGLQQMTSTSSDGSSVITLQFNLSLNIDVAEQEVQQSINAAGTFLPRRPADAADLQQDQSRRRADSDAGAHVRDHAALARWKIWPTRGWRRRSRSCPASAWSASAADRSRRCGFRPIPRALASYGLNLEDLRTAIVAANVNQAKGNFDGPHQAYQIGANDQLLSSGDYRAADRRLPQRRAGQADRRRRRDRRRGERPAGRLDERDRRRSSSTFSGSPAPTSSQVVDRIKTAAAAAHSHAAASTSR